MGPLVDRPFPARLRAGRARLHRPRVRPPTGARYGAPAYSAPGYGGPAYGASVSGAPSYAAPPAYGAAASAPPSSGAAYPGGPAPLTAPPGSANASGSAPGPAYAGPMSNPQPASGYVPGAAGSIPLSYYFYPCAPGVAPGPANPCYPVAFSPYPMMPNQYPMAANQYPAGSNPYPNAAPNFSGVGTPGYGAGAPGYGVGAAKLWRGCAKLWHGCAGLWHGCSKLWRGCARLWHRGAGLSPRKHWSIRDRGCDLGYARWGSAAGRDAGDRGCPWDARRGTNGLAADEHDFGSQRYLHFRRCQQRRAAWLLDGRLCGSGIGGGAGTGPLSSDQMQALTGRLGAMNLNSNDMSAMGHALGLNDQQVSQIQQNIQASRQPAAPGMSPPPPPLYSPQQPSAPSGLGSPTGPVSMIEAKFQQLDNPSGYRYSADFQQPYAVWLQRLHVAGIDLCAHPERSHHR